MQQIVGWSLSVSISPTLNKPAADDGTENIEVYNIICDSLGINPRPNNGTLRLPLKTIGFHTPNTPIEEPDDPQMPAPPAIPPLPSAVAPSGSPTEEEDEANAVISISPIEESSAADPNVNPPSVVGVDNPNTGVERPVVDDEGNDKSPEEENNDFLRWIKGKLDGFKGWFNSVIGSENDEGDK